MNKFEKLMLASAIFATSELVAMEEYIPNTIMENTTLKVSGKGTANTVVTVNGTLKIDDGGAAIKGLYLFADPETKASDERKDFPGLLTDTELNTDGNKLKTDDIIYERGSTDENYGKSAIIGLKDALTLAVSITTNSEPVIRIGF